MDIWKCTCTFLWGEGPSVSLDVVRICDRKKWLRYSTLICEEHFILHWKEVCSLRERSTYSSLPYQRFAILFPVSVSICSPKYYVENSKNKQFLSFTLCTLLSSMMKFLTILLCLTQDMNCSFVQCMLPISHLVAILVIRLTIELSQCLCSGYPYFTYWWP